MDGEENNNQLVAAPKPKAVMAFGLGLDLNQVKWVGEVMQKSGLFSDTNDLPKAIVKIMAGQELGLAPFAAMNGINIIKGRPTMAGNTIAAKVKSHPKYDYRISKNDATECIIDWFEIIDGKREKVGSNAFTMEMAIRANLVKGDSGWTKYPEAMLFNRAISAGQKLHAPDVFNMAVYTEDEAIEIEANTGYIPASDGASVPKPRKPKVVNNIPADAQKADIVLDEPVRDVIEDEEGADPEDHPSIKLPEKLVPVDKKFKDGVEASFEVLGLEGTARMKVIKEATGKLDTKGLSEQQWRNLEALLTEKAINMGDEIATETEVKEEPAEDDNQASLLDDQPAVQHVDETKSEGGDDGSGAPNA